MAINWEEEEYRRELLSWIHVAPMGVVTVPAVFMSKLVNRAHLAHQALDVMQRRGWMAKRSTCANRNLWVVYDENDCQLRHERGEDEDGDPVWLYPEWASDPFTALVEADKWYRENVEAKQ